MERERFLKIAASSTFLPFLTSLVACRRSPKEESEIPSDIKNLSEIKDIVPEQNIFGSISELKQANPANINMNYVLVLGYHSPDGKGGGVFYWDENTKESGNNGTDLESALPKFEHEGRWKRLFNNYLTVFSFGAKAEPGYNSTTAFQNMADTLGFVRIPETKIPFEIDTIHTTRPTIFSATEENAFIKMRKIDIKNSAFKILHENSGLLKGIHIDANQSNRSCVSLQADQCFCDITAANVTANSDSTTYVSGIWITGNDCNFSIKGSNFKNTGQTNGSVPRLVTVQGTSDNYQGNIEGENIQCGLTIGSRTGVGKIRNIHIKNAMDNGVYQLGGRCQFDKIVYEGSEEAFVAGGKSNIDTFIVRKSGSSPISLNNNELLHIKTLKLEPDNTEGFSTLIRTRIDKDGGKIKLGSVEGKLKGGGLIGMGNSGGAVEDLTINRADLTYEFDRTTSGPLSRWVDMEAVEKFDLNEIDIKIIDLNNDLTPKDIFYTRLPTSNLKRKSRLINFIVKIYKSDQQASSPAQCRIINFNQKDINYLGLAIQTNIGPYGREYNYGVIPYKNVATGIPESGYFTKSQIFFKRNFKNEQTLGWICMAGGHDPVWKEIGSIYN